MAEQSQVASAELTLGTALVAIENALIAKGRHIGDVAMWRDRKKPGRWLFRIDFDPAFYSTEQAFGTTWKGFTKLLTGDNPAQLLRQIERMDVAAATTEGRKCR